MGFFDSLNPATWVKAGAEVVAGVIKEPLNEWQKRKTVKAQAKADLERIGAETDKAVALGKLEAAKQGQVIESDWDMRAQEQAKNSWKDEFLMILLFFPVGALFVCSMFFPERVENVIRAVTALNKFPVWYQIILWGVIAFVFGLRWLIQPLVNKFGGKKS